jgi:acetolactate synthase-1/2/3 large subunit
LHIVVVVGDGGLQMTIQEIETIFREKLPVTILVMNNRSLGLIRTLQDTYYDGKHYASVQDYSVRNFTSISLAYGIASCTVDSTEKLLEVIATFPDYPRMINVLVDPRHDCHPRITERRPLEDMFPFLSDAELKDNMIVPYKRKPI